MSAYNICLLCRWLWKLVNNHNTYILRCNVTLFPWKKYTTFIYKYIYVAYKPTNNTSEHVYVLMWGKQNTTQTFDSSTPLFYTAFFSWTHLSACHFQSVTSLPYHGLTLRSVSKSWHTMMKRHFFHVGKLFEVVAGCL